MQPAQSMFDYFEDRTLPAKFERFDEEHPDVYRQLVQLTREWMSVGHRKLGIATLFERLRWEWHVSGLADEDGTTEQIERRADDYGKAFRAAIAKHSFADIAIASGFTAEQVAA